MANNQIVPGYTIRQATSPPSRAGDLEVQLVAEYRGSGLLGKVIRLTNKSAEAVNITESGIAPRDSIAVSLATSTLKSGASTIAYLVGANGETSNDRAREQNQHHRTARNRGGSAKLHSGVSGFSV